MASSCVPQAPAPRWLPVVLGNLMPLVAVLLFDWGAFDVVFLYWLENAVIGLFNVLKMAFARPELATIGECLHAAAPGFLQRHMMSRVPEEAREQLQAQLAPASLVAMKLFLIPFFVVHYSMFMVVHLVFILVLLGTGLARHAGGFRPLETLSSSISLGLIVALALLVIEHGFLFYREYWKGGGYKRTLPALQMSAPYPRIVVMHLAILFGGFLLVLFSLPRFMALLLVGLKIALELIQSDILRRIGSKARA